MLIQFSILFHHKRNLKSKLVHVRDESCITIPLKPTTIKIIKTESAVGLGCLHNLLGKLCRAVYILSSDTFPRQ